MRSELRAAKVFLEELSGADPTRVLCAVSGGMDSMCLLHLLAFWGRERKLEVTAAHFNHQLRGAESDRDEAFVQSWCQEQGIPFVAGRGDVNALAREEGLTLEEAARTARYAFLSRQRQEGGFALVLTAHHAEDNAETMLLNLLRGTGTRGLAGIPELRGCIARPFLRVTQAELASYAAAHQISFVEDSTNRLDDAARNVLRHKVLPVLRELNPRAVENMTRAAELLARDEEALSHAADRLLGSCRLETERASLAAADCETAERAVVNRCLWAMMTYVSGHQKDLSFTHVESVYSLLEGAPGREISLPYRMTAFRDGERLVIRKNPRPPEETEIEAGQRTAFGQWIVEVSKAPGGQGMALPEGARLSVTPWRREDRMQLPGGRGERSLKRLFADHGIPPVRRETTPVLRVNGRAAAVPGIGVDQRFLPRGKAEIFVTFYQKTEERA